MISSAKHAVAGKHDGMSIGQQLGIVGLVLLMLLASPAQANDTGTIAEFTRGMVSHDGFIPVHTDPATGKVYLEVLNLEEDFLHTVMLATGFGSSAVGLDRGQPAGQGLVRFERHGPRVLLVQQNTAFVAGSGDPVEALAVEQSFPTSVMGSFPIVREEGDRLLIDATSMLLSDVGNVRGTMRRTGMGEVRVDTERSVISGTFTKAFARNTEVRAILSFTSDNPNAVLNRHAPDGRFFTIEQHHSFVKLPDQPYPTRTYDPRTGNSPMVVADYSQGFDQDYRSRVVARWRLEPADPGAYLQGQLVEPVTPIVFYIDRSLQEPYRSAYIEGVLWWNVAFEAAGFRNAVQVRDLPDDADPMDARYSLLQLLHRSGTGPSVGPGFRDPRSGELLRAVPRMDSHRSLVNYNIFAGLLPVYDDLGIDPQMSVEQFIMDRRRHHVAHEVGHTLGLPHNHISAAQGRNSVMDYPFPYIELDAEGRPDISRAYEMVMGYGDTLAIRYAYTWFPTPEAEAEGLTAIVQEALDRGHLFLTGGDASLSGSYPEVQQWVEGSNMFEAVERTMAVRRVMLRHFDERAIRPGEPMAWLNHRLAHVYLHHRYSVQGLVKNIGGMQYRYALRGDGQIPTQVIPAQDQRAALQQLLVVLSPEELEVPERILRLIPPLPSGFDQPDPWIDSPAGPALDPLAMARTYAQEVVDSILHRQRLARVAAFYHADSGQMSLNELMSGLLDASWGNHAARSGTLASYIRVVERAVLDGLFTLASDSAASSEVRDAADYHLALLAQRLSAEIPSGSGVEAAHRSRAARELERYLATGDVPDLRSGVMDFMSLPWP
jgi:hypothetical protein